MPKGRGLYLNLPFEEGRGPSRAEAFRIVEALRIEIASLQELASPDRTILVSFAVGGGGPLELPDEVLARAVREIDARFHLAPHAERTCEAALASCGPARLGSLRDAGIGRISLVRTEGAEPALLGAAVRAARAAGFERVAVDLPFGPAGTTLLAWGAARLEEADHVSIVENRPLGEGEWGAAYDDMLRLLDSFGFAPYEISHFARPGGRSLHLRLVHGGGDVIGIGPGARSSIGFLRRENVRDWARWADRLLSGGSPVAEEERLDRRAALSEKVLLGIRRKGGVRLPLVEAACEGEERRGLPGRLSALVEAGYLLRRGGAVLLTARGIRVSDAVAAELLGYSPLLP